MSRISCPTCVCWYKDNNNLFPDLTSSGVHQLLQKIRSKKTFSAFLENEKIQLNYKNNEWIFPRWICRSVQNKLLLKIKELGILPPNNFLELDPASDPDDMPPNINSIIHPPWILSFDDPEDPYLRWKKPWIPKINELHIDE